MGKTEAFVCGIALAIFRIIYGDTGDLVCASPPHIDGAVAPELKAKEHNIGTPVIYNCPLGYTSLNITNHISFCKINIESGKAEWTLPDILCISDFACASPPDIDGVVAPEFKAKEHHFGTAVVYNCPLGYTSSNITNHISFCKINTETGKAEWTLPNITCNKTDENRNNPTTEGFQIPRGELPNNNMVSSSPRTTDITRNPECVCTYESDDPVLKIQRGKKILNQRGTVKLGETVSLECPNYFKILKWTSNGFVFSGKAYMICSTCRKWQREDFPICDTSTSDTYITYDGDFKISPGGIVDIRMGESHRYKCRSTYGPPTWDTEGRQSVQVNTYEVRKHGRLSYVSYLNINEASDQHNGKYECFRLDGSLHRVGSTFLFLNVQGGEDKSVSTTEPAVTTSSGVTEQPKLDVKRNEDCFCTYQHEDENVKAQIGHKALVEGDKIKRGEIVSFKCKVTTMALIWHNGLRLTGKANMICNACKIWQKTDVPICKYYLKSDSIISFYDDLNLLPGGIAIAQNAGNNQFSCINNWNYPEWDYGRRKDVNVTKIHFIANGFDYYVSSLIISKQKDELSGEYECYLNDNDDRRIGSAFLHLQANDYVSCPELSYTLGLNVTYSKDFSVGSIAVFKCSNSTKYLSGSNSSVCQEDGRWSNSIPSCEDSKCSIHDLTMSLSEDIEPDISNVFEEDVTLGFEMKLKCDDKSVIIGNSKAQCEKQGKWKLGNFQCVPGCVLNTDPSSNLLVHPMKDYYRIGDLISLSCPPGETLSSDVEIIMCFAGKWSNSLPECIPLKRKPSI